MTKKQRADKTRQLKKEQKAKQSKYDRLSAENASLQKTVDNGYRIESYDDDGQARSRRIKIDSTEKAIYQEIIAANKVVLYKLSVELEDITYELETLVKESKNDSMNELKQLVKSTMEQQDNRMIEILINANDDKDGKDAITDIAEEMKSKNYSTDDFKKAIRPILNEYRNTRKQRSIISLRKTTTEKLMAKVKELAA